MTDWKTINQVRRFPDKVGNARQRLQKLQTEAQMIRAPEATILAAVIEAWDDAVGAKP